MEPQTDMLAFIMTNINKLNHMSVKELKQMLKDAKARRNLSDPLHREIIAIIKQCIQQKK